MPRHKNKICLGCSRPFTGRRDAKTCSATCRKRFQRAKIIYRHILAEDEQKTGFSQGGYALSKNLRNSHAER